MRTRTRITTLAGATLVVAAAGSVIATNAQAAAGCRVAYTITSSWQGGFGADVAITNLGDPINGWNLTFTFPSGQTVSQMWNGSHTQTGAAVTVRNVAYNAAVATNATTGFGFNGTGSAATPTGFALNGTACTGTVPNPPTSSPATPPGGTCTVAPVDPQATPAARRLLCYLYSQYGNHILSGQQESTWIGGPDYEINHIQQNTGKYPAIRGLDMGDSPDFGARAAAWWNAGGIPMVGYHMGSPALDADGYDSSRQRADISAALTAGTADNRRLNQRLDAVAAQLNRVSGGAVIFRPFHEAGGTWFWWSMEGGAQYNRLWQYTFNYLTKTRGLHHLVWLHGYNGQPNSAFYPGRQWVDVGGADTYAGDGNYDPQLAMYNASRGIYGTSLPIALHENGPIPDPGRLQSTGARWVLFATWHGNHLTVSNSLSHLRTVYGHSYVVTRDELPNLRG
ncbi:glycosyl hydrolase [Actinoplanes sp. CA-252034]|uniref:glycosyl hydrolase n=1 Tax=Actinoplanes sp. CA-252034 TaxID=3239906 RepID=UPI003D976626